MEGLSYDYATYRNFSGKRHLSQHISDAVKYAKQKFVFILAKCLLFK